MKSVLIAVFTLLLSTGLYARKNILVVGNSMTFFYDMPKMLQAMCDEAGGDYVVKQSTFSGVNLGNHLRYFLVADSGYWRMPLAGEIPSTIRTLQSAHWDRVIFQEAPLRLLVPEMVALNLMSILRSFDSMLAPGKTRMALVEPFVSEEKLPFRLCYPWHRVSRQLYGKQDSCCSPIFPTSDSMHRYFRQTMREIRSGISWDIIPLGSAFEVCKKQHPDIPLYGDSFGHPSKEISFLTALLYYRLVTGRRPDLLHYDAGLEPDAAAKLRAIATVDFE